MENALLLGLVQGLTEFLPVSSSGHLALAQILMGWEEPPIAYDVLLHFSTMVATAVFFWSDIVYLLTGWCAGIFDPTRRSGEGWRYGWAIILGTMATAPVAFLVEDFAERWFASPSAVGVALLITATLLWVSTSRREGSVPVSAALGALMGLAQGIAVVPGLSRSGATISAGLIAGARRKDAFRLSFLLSLPAIAGATLIQCLRMESIDGFITALPSGWLVGCVLASASGYLALVFLRRVVISGRFKAFAVYCAALGAISILLEYMTR